MNRTLQHILKPLSAVLILLALGQAFTVMAAPPAQPPDPLGALRANSVEQPVLTYSSKTGVVDFVSASVPTVGNTADERSRNFLKSYGAMFGVTDAQGELSVMRNQTDEIGMSHVTYEQQYRGVPVFGARLAVHLDRDGRVTATNGQFQPNIALDNVTPSIAAGDVKSIAQKAIGATRIEWQQDPRLVIWTHNLGGKAAQLTWEVIGFADEPLGRWHSFIDAHSGAVAYQLNELDTAKNRTVYSANNGTFLNNTLICTEGTPGNCSDIDSQDAFNFSGTTYDFYFNSFGRDSVDGAGLGLISTIHYSVDYNNAFWNGSRMVYGDGDGVSFVVPLDRDLDVVAHELTHGVTQFTSNLFYQDQSGALNESYSDVFAVFVNPTNWVIGEVSFHDHTNGLRRLDDPTKGGQWNPNNPFGNSSQPDSMSNIAVLPSQLDNGGVHINSGIPNKVAYLITNGGSFNGVTVTGIGFTKAAKIYYRTQSLYNTPFTDFDGAAHNTYRACKDLIGQFGIVQANCDSVQNGFAAVGLGPSTAQNKKIYLPVITRQSALSGIFGRVTNNAASAGGIALRLYRCPFSGGCTLVGSTTTDGNGNYQFIGIATLPTNLIYSVTYIQPGANCSLWDEWDATSIDHYTAGQTVHGGDFDIHAPTLNSPIGGVTGTSKTFNWSLRTLPAGMLQDLPELYILNSSGSSLLFDSGVMARNTTSRGPISGFSIGATYRWRIYDYGPEGLGFPVSACDKFFTITSSAAQGNIDITPKVGALGSDAGTITTPISQR